MIGGIIILNTIVSVLKVTGNTIGTISIINRMSFGLLKQRIANHRLLISRF